MAAPSGQFKPRPYFLALAGIIVLLYGLVFLTGNHKPHPKLGLDLIGGTSITMSAQTIAGGKPPTADQLAVAREIINRRVDAVGVSEAEVVVQKPNDIVVNVAGQNKGAELDKLLDPAKLEFRTVLGTAQDVPKPAAAPSASPSATPSAPSSPSATPSSTAPGSTVKPSPSPSGNGDAALAPRKAPSPNPSPSGASSPSPAPPSPSASSSAPQGAANGQTAALDAVKQKLGSAYTLAANLQDATSAAQDPSMMAALAPFYTLTPEEVGALPVDIQFNTPTVTCEQLNGRNPSWVTDDKFLGGPVVACDSEQPDVKYKLDAAKVQGQDVAGAQALYDPTNYGATGGWYVSLSFTGKGQTAWSNLTAAEVNNQVAIVLDNQVVSAPVIQQAINGPAVISGSGITDASSHLLAQQLQFGSLPLSFTKQTGQNVSATLGLQQLRSGLLAGAIGLALVILYCLIYYRALGLVVIASLVASASIVFASLVLLGRSMGFTLSLAGIAGFIVAIGITADSFVVFFERLKDEVREGRTMRSGVPRAWARARRTILSADAVSFLAAVVLFWLASGPVAGFAFTLGLSTLIDLLIVFLFTHPLVSVLSNSRTFTSPKFSGLGEVRAAGTSETSSGGRIGAMRTKES